MILKISLRQRLRGAVVLAVLLGAFLGFDAVGQDRIRVAALSTVVADLAEQVGGDRVDVVNLIPPGRDPHGFEPTVRDVKSMAGADLLVASGMGFEPFLPKLQGSLGPDVRVVIVGDSLEPLMVEQTGDGHDHDHDHGHAHSHGEPGEDGSIADPHWWHSVANVKVATQVVRDALIRVDPTNEKIYAANARAYQTELDALAKWIRLQVAKIPRDRRILIMSHDALGYFANDHHFTVIPIQGVSAKDQASSKQVRALIEKIKESGVRGIFAENIENPRVLSAITKETGAEVGGVLYADGLGKDEAETYISMMRHNVTAIVDGLQ